MSLPTQETIMVPEKSPPCTTAGTVHSRPSPAELVGAARAGDERAWAALVRRLEPMLRSVARGYGLSAAQVDDVVQSAWMLLFEHIGDLRAPEAVVAWLSVTVRREAFRMLQRHVREYLTDDPSVGEIADTVGPDAQLLQSERGSALRRRIATLPERHRSLMELMLSEPALDYRQISARTGIPTGSIGPIRGRCLVRMANDPAIQALRD
jgi:RNA polymerase sigma factor (sigma-70 family)